MKTRLGRLVTAASATAMTTLMILMPHLASAQDNVLAGREKAAMCQACHGMDGLSKIAEAPNLAAQPFPYIVKQLEAFRSGQRKNEMMSIVAKSLSDADIANLAAYYSTIEVTVGNIPGE